MTFLLRTLSRSYLRHHRLKTFLTLAGIVAGVATFTAIRSAQGTLVTSLRATVDRAAGHAHLQVTGSGGVPEAIQDRLRDVPGVAAVAPVIEQVVQIVEPAGGSLLVLGIDLVGDRQMRDYRFAGDDEDIDDPLVFLAQPDSIAISTTAAAAAGIARHARITIATGALTRQAVVRGLIEPQGFATAFGGRLAMTDVYAAQSLFGRGRFFDHVDVRLEEGVALDEGRRRIADAIGPGFQVESPERRSAGLERLITSFIAGFDLSSMLALVLGGFLIFNAFSVAVSRRRRDIGVLRALGATTGQVQALFLLEASLLGLAGSVLGYLLGAGLAGRSLAVMARAVETGYGLTPAPSAGVDPAIAVQAVALGVAASIAGALLPARSAARVLPSTALAAGVFASTAPSGSRGRTLAGLALLASAIALAISGAAAQAPWLAGRPLVLTVLALGVAGTVLPAGSAARLLTKLAAAASRHLSPVAGRLAADALVGHPRRTAGTTAAVMLSVAFVAGTGTYLGSMEAAFRGWVHTVITADLYVRTSLSLAGSAARFAWDDRLALLDVDGVAAIDGFRLDRIPFRGEQVALVATDAEGAVHRTRQRFLAGTRESFLRGLTREGRCAITDNLARRFGLSVGDSVDVGSPSGPLVLPVSAIVSGFFSEYGAVLIDRAFFAAHWHDDRVDSFHVTLVPGADPERARQQIAAALPPTVPALVITRAEYLAEMNRALAGYFRLLRVTVAVALAVAVIGVVASLVISVAERTRDIGVLRAIGATRAQVRASVVAESLIVVGTGLVMAVVPGALLARFLETTVSEVYAGMQLPGVVPAGLIGTIAAVVPIVAVLAAWLPARHAVSLPVSEAIGYE